MTAGMVRVTSPGHPRVTTLEAEREGWRNRGGAREATAELRVRRLRRRAAGGHAVGRCKLNSVDP